MGDGDSLPVNDECRIADFYLAGKAAMGRIKARQIGHALQIRWLIDGDDLKIVLNRRFAQGAQEAAPDTTVAVDGETQGGVL